ncbi:MAG TPA: class I SAM-dependent methyltransferase [Candidatus Hydrogenedentes bacterium]|nr:class I SAM-dependent methyltransferase [Candidatus Hydrogenedentota bacterium]HOL76053.1 class I SAM-dependent methyltransferase [Candidatus Hydrogenedentota bacterium]HPO84667.1 class I SAM-dependent methyltransferase [Candidatus Hydrogenedentota bacterium]
MNPQAKMFDYLAAQGTLYEYAPDALQRLNRVVRPEGRTLDLGCGDGTIGAALDAPLVIGVDISWGCARLASARGLKTVVADARGAALPFAEAAFETVVCVDILHHLGGDWDIIMREMDRVLRPSGRLVIIEPDARNLFVRWTQAPRSPIRVAPCPDEPAIYPDELLVHLLAMGYTYSCSSIHLEARQVVRSIFPLWQRLLKAPFVLALALLFRHKPKKFLISAQKPSQDITNG